MRYKRNLQKIMQELAAYKAVVDEAAAGYMTEKTKHEKQLESMKGKYTPEYIEGSRKNWQPKANYKGIIDLARETHKKIAMQYLNEIREEMDSYFSAPADSSFSSMMAAIKTVGLTMSNRELQLLESSSSGYWERRLLGEVAISRVSKTSKVELDEANEPKRTKVDEPKPFNGISVPDIEMVYNVLQETENSIKIAFSSYCGDGCELADVIFPRTQPDDNLKKEYGIEPPKQMRDALTISKMTTAPRFFDETHHSYVTLDEMLGSLEATMPKQKKKTELTENDRQLIDSILDPKYPTLAADKAIEISRLNEGLRELLLLDERYNSKVREALGVEDGEQDDKWNNAGTKTENLDRATSIKIAKESAIRMQAESHSNEILDNYRR